MQRECIQWDSKRLKWLEHLINHMSLKFTDRVGFGQDPIMTVALFCLYFSYLNLSLTQSCGIPTSSNWDNLLLHSHLLREKENGFPQLSQN